MMEMKKDIFISYRNDGVGSNFAARITSDLRNSGYSVYFNPDEARSDDFPERLKQAIESCKDFICIVTETYISQLKQNEKNWKKYSSFINKWSSNAKRCIGIA